MSNLARERWAGVDGIYGGAYEGRVFVLTHRPPAAGGDPRVAFVSGGSGRGPRHRPRRCRRQERRNFGGSLTRQCLGAGLLDEIVVHLAPLLLGRGVRLFGDELDGPLELERVSLGEAERLTDPRFRVVK